MIPELEKPKITEIKVRMDCNGCVQKIKKALYGINGIYDLYIDFPQQKLTIIGWADPDKIMKAIKKTRKIATICSDPEQPTDPHAAAQPPDHHPPQHHGGETANIPSHEVVVVGGSNGNSHTEITPGHVVVHETHSGSHSDPTVMTQPHGLHETGQVHVTHHQPPEHGHVTVHQAPEHGHVTYHHAPEHGHVVHHTSEPGHVVHQHTSESGHVVQHNVPEHGHVVHHQAPEHGHVVHHQAPEHGQVIHHQAPQHGQVIDHQAPQHGHVVHHQAPEHGQVIHHQAPEHGHVVHHRPSENGHVIHHQPTEHGHGHSTSSSYHHNIQGAAPVTVTHSYNTHKPSPYVTEYIRPLTSHKPSPNAYEHTPQQPTHYSPKIIDRYSEEYYNTGTSNNNGNITSIFSDENPNACTLM